MTVVVSFIKSVSGGVNASAVGECRVRENLTVGGTTTATVLNGEMVVIGNAETSMIAAAFGATPDAAATASSGVTSAGFPVPAGQNSYPLLPPAGSKINVKAVT